MRKALNNRETDATLENNMKNEMKLPKPIETYIKAVNAHDQDAFE
jgi:hypothetical protein